MERTARVPGPGGTGTAAGTSAGTSVAGGPIRRLLSLAAALTAAAARATRDAASNGTGGAGGGAAGAAGPVAGVAGPGGPGAGAGAWEGSSVVAAPLGVELVALSDGGVLEWARSVEQLSRWVQALQVQAAGELDSRAREGRYLCDGQATGMDVLSDVLHLSRAEAGRRLGLAGHFLPATDALTTVATEPDQPVLAGAFFAGTTSIEQALVASH
ncbi:hypothetical protein, partial [Arthrobacter sp. STN4]|uniref:hypothetical protein n=1 Tax=Arthrobacter sp. STN4 TaxID=2923276 RepID=UPI0035C24701|nr:hypothetical protein [Arthrobacter sp. STN4]